MHGSMRSSQTQVHRRAGILVDKESHVPRTTVAMVSREQECPSIAHLFTVDKVFTIGHDHILHAGLQDNGFQGSLLPASVPPPASIGIRDEDVDPEFCVLLIQLLGFKNELLDYGVVAGNNTGRKVSEITTLNDRGEDT